MPRVESSFHLGKMAKLAIVPRVESSFHFGKMATKLAIDELTDFSLWKVMTSER